MEQVQAYHRETDVLIVGGEEITEVPGVCRHTRWEFTSNNVRFIVGKPVT